MEEKYEIQRIARRYMDKIPELPDDFEIDSCFFNGIDREDLYRGLYDFREAVKNIHKDIITDPEQYGMSCLEAEDLMSSEPVTVTENKARKSFFRYANAFKAFAIYGEIVGDCLVMDCHTVRGNKISKLNFILRHLNDQGFEFLGVTEDFSIPKSGEFFLSYPDNPYVIHLIKAFARIENMDIGMVLLRADWRVLKYSDSKKFEYNLSDMLRGLSSFDRSIITQCNDIFMNAGYKSIVTDTGGYQLDYKNTKDKDRFIYFKRERDQLVIRLRFENMNQYENELYNCDPVMLDIILSRMDCGDCDSRCMKPVRFIYENKMYKKCRFIRHFEFVIPSEEVLNSVKLLLSNEIKYRIS